MDNWKCIPRSLKVVFVLSGLWVFGSFFAISGRYELGLPFFGLWVHGFFAGFVVLLLDIIGPAAFMYAVWMRKSWGARVAYLYMVTFILNSVVALFTFKEQLGIMPILMPAVITSVFLYVVYKNRKYFN